MAEASTVFDRDETITLAKGDLNFLAGICIPDVFKYLFPAFYLTIWSLLVDAISRERGLLQLAFGIPRGFAKTVFLKVFVVYTILFTKRQFILIVCNTEALALNFIADVADILDSQNIKMLFGDWRLGMEKDTQAQKKFGFRGRDIIIAGIGVGTSMRGLNLKMRRPDVFIMDDMQSREDAEQKLIAEKQLTWMMGTLMKARSYECCLFIYVGNMYPFEGSILRKLKYNPKWISFISGALLSDGESIWPELRPTMEILEELENDIAMGHPEIFYSEVLNDEEAGTASGIDISKIPPYPPNLDSTEPQGGFIIIDPASGKEQGNDVSIGAFYIYDGVPVLHKLEVGKFSPGDTIRKALELALSLRIMVICVESNAYQFTLIYWFNQIMQQLEIAGIHLGELNASGHLSKNAKIKDALQQLLKGEILLHPTTRSQVVYQITHWNPIRKNNTDDILDLLTWAYKAIELFGHLMELHGSIMVSRNDRDVPALFGEELALPI